MTIDDELLLELFKPDRYGKVGDNALITDVVGTRNILYRLEQHTSRLAEEDIETVDDIRYAIEHIITPDITIILPTKDEKEIAIELENDIAWDFGKSLRQIKKYTSRFKDVRVIIPETYERFAPFYKNEGFRVYLWKAKRKWECVRCGTVTINESRVPPQCENKNCKNKRREEFDLVGLVNVEVMKFE